LLKTRSRVGINQSLALCVKTFMIVLILHRPYLRADPSAYPESAEICWRAAHLILSAYHTGSDVKASIFWSWWTMSYRAFHAGAVCAFLAIRQPGSDLAKKCLEDLRGAITILKDRTATWNTAHPVQADLTDGLLRLEKLAAAAMQQHTNSPNAKTRDPSRLSVHWSPTSSTKTLTPNKAESQTPTAPNTLLSQIRGFPQPSIISNQSYPGQNHMDPLMPGPSNGALPSLPAQGMPGSGMTGPVTMMNDANPGASMSMGMGVGAQVAPPDGLGFVGDGFNGTDTLALPQFWASVFGIKMENNGLGGMST